QGEWPGALWQAVEENGLTLPLVPEAKGGAGGTWGDAYVVVSAAGRHAVPLPLPETIVASWLLAAAGLEVPLGPLTVAPVQRDERLKLVRRDGGLRLDGTAARVPWGRAAKHVVVVDETDGRATVALVAAGGARVTRDTNLAREPRDTLAFVGAPVLAAAPAAGLPHDADRLHLRAPAPVRHAPALVVARRVRGRERVGDAAGPVSGRAGRRNALAVPRRALRSTAGS